MRIGGFVMMYERECLGKWNYFGWEWSDLVPIEHIRIILRVHALEASHPAVLVGQVTVQCEEGGWRPVSLSLWHMTYNPTLELVLWHRSVYLPGHAHMHLNTHPPNTHLCNRLVSTFLSVTQSLQLSMLWHQPPPEQDQLMNAVGCAVLDTGSYMRIVFWKSSQVGVPNF